MGWIKTKCMERFCGQHYRVETKVSGSEDQEDRIICCNAFPEGIPNEILFGDNLHLTPLEGQKNDIVYKEYEFTILKAE